MITQVDGEWVVHDSFAAVFYGPGARLLPRPFTRSTVADPRPPHGPMHTRKHACICAHTHLNRFDRWTLIVAPALAGGYTRKNTRS